MRHVDAHPDQLLPGLLREVVLVRGEDPGRPFEEDDLRLLGVDMAEVAGQRVPGDLGERPGELHPGRPGADDDEPEPGGPTGRVGLALGGLEGEEDAAADVEGVLDALQAGGESRPVVAAEVGMRCARGDDQVVVGQDAVGQQDGLRRHVDARGLGQHDLRVRLVPQHAPDRRGDVARVQGGRRDLIEQGLEQVMIPPVDDDHPDRARRSRRAASSPPNPPPMMTTRGRSAVVGGMISVSGDHGRTALRGQGCGTRRTGSGSGRNDVFSQFRQAARSYPKSRPVSLTRAERTSTFW